MVTMHRNRVRLEVGDSVNVTRNQGLREATVLAIIQEEVLVEYEMPHETTALSLMTLDTLEDDGWYASVSYRKLPLRWLRELIRTGTGWIAQPQRTLIRVKLVGRWDTVQFGKQIPSPAEMLERKVKQ